MTPQVKGASFLKLTPQKPIEILKMIPPPLTPQTPQVTLSSLKLTPQKPIEILKMIPPPTPNKWPALPTTTTSPLKN